MLEETKSQLADANESYSVKVTKLCDEAKRNGEKIKVVNLVYWGGLSP